MNKLSKLFNKNNNTTNDNSDNDKFIADEKGEMHITIKKFHKTCKNKNILKLHLDHMTAPNSLNFDRLPKPFFVYDSDYINEYNDLIFKFQKDIMNLNMSYLNKNKLSLIDEVKKIKSDLQN